jgi:DNA-binding NarL/FixJ family response regulator
LVVTPHRKRVEELRGSFQKLNIPHVSVCKTHRSAFERLPLSYFSHVLFEAKATDMPVKEFVEKLLKLDIDTRLIVLTEDPQIDDVFSLLQSGAHAFLIPPVGAEVLDEVLFDLASGPPISDMIKDLADSKAFLSRAVLNNLRRLTAAQSAARYGRPGADDLPQRVAALRGAVETGKMFCPEGLDGLRDQVVEDLVDYAKRASTRLRKLRSKLQQERLARLQGKEASGDED